MYTNSELLIEASSSITKIDQIIYNIRREIEVGTLKSNERLPSIRDFSQKHRVARITVEKAYKQLQLQGYIFSVSGKGNFVSSPTLTSKGILLIVDKLDSYSREIYSAFSKKLNVHVKIDLQIHHGDSYLLNQIALSSQGKYHFYVLIPPSPEAMNEDQFASIISPFPLNKLVIIKRRLSSENFKCINIYQDFSEDIFEALCSSSELFRRYQGITILAPDGVSHFIEISKGVKKFCIKHSKNLSIKSSLLNEDLRIGEVYMVLTDSDLADLAKRLRRSDLKAGKDVGLLSFQNNMLEELLDVTVITSDFEGMSETAARLIFESRSSLVRNSYKLIQRKSL
jgi:DNA-binding transcriptional regulator YhcF (GntR family)